jgi:hypothetical protein
MRAMPKTKKQLSPRTLIPTLIIVGVVCLTILPGVMHRITFRDWNRYQSDRVPLFFMLPPKYRVERCDSDVILEAFRKEECLNFTEPDVTNSQSIGSIDIKHVGVVEDGLEHLRGFGAFPGTRKEYVAIKVGNKTGYYDKVGEDSDPELIVFVYANNLEYRITLPKNNQKELKNMLQSFQF